VTTFGGHPVSCAAAYATLDELLSKDYGKKAKHIESITREVLTADGISEIRGVGGMLGMELQDRNTTQKVVEDCMDKGIILGWTLHSNTLVRIAPPLIIEQNLLRDTLREINQSVQKFA
jgi:acetylornithine/succinyldiaminopimelate/putrescine aminotransferase